ncbi:MAG: DEAD/DEAH box helicase [candidate division NC10 bacterium]|nr:DEAD/DEAH box helicase [candidate division NC10 bacterium]
MGADLRFWSKAAKLALELLARQRVVPSLVRVRQGKTEAYHALWEAVLEEAGEKERVALLTEGMPPLCRALVRQTKDEASQEPSARALLLSFVQAALDESIRLWLAKGTKKHRDKEPRSQGANFQFPISNLKFQSLHVSELWAEALGFEDPNLHAPQTELRTLYDEIRSWTAQIHGPGEAATFRTCFRLEPPPLDDLDGRREIQAVAPRVPAWALSFFLQATDDPSLLVPAEKVWRESKRTLRFLNRRFEQPQERLLADLGKASRLFPPIEESLRAARPEGCRLTTDQAYGFLREAAWLLEESGFGLLVPPWWDRTGARGAKLGVKLRLQPLPKASSPGRGLLGLDAIVRYDWQLALGEEPLTREEFEQLAALKVPLVRLRGQWVELKPDQIEAALHFFQERRHQGEISLGEALRLGLGQGEAEGRQAPSLPVVGFEAEDWIGQLTRRLIDGERLTELPPPAGFNGVLRPYQGKGFSWLAFLRQWGLGACLADDMGLGKTIQLIALLLHDKEQGVSRGSTLLICPTSVVGNWQREIARFGPALKVLVHHGIGRREGPAFVQAAAQHDLVISTYSLAHRDEAHLTAVEWEGVVLDEAQNIKNPSAKQTQSIRRFPARYRVALTGTPVENRLSELWSIIEFLNPGYLGPASLFRSRFALPIERYQDQERSARLRALVQPFVLRRVKTDPNVIRDLPDKLEMKVFCPLTREQATLYEAVVKDMLHRIEESEGITRKGLVLATLSKLKQVCNHPAHFLGDGSRLEGRSGKLERLTEMLEEVLAEEDQALVFTQFAKMGDLLKRHLQGTFGREVLFLHGGVPQKARVQLVDRFQEEGGPPIFILSLKAGGLGLNLTRANHVFHFDRWWNPAVENQATDRAFRIGQTRNVQVHKFTCSGTLEERIDAMIESKKALAEQIIGTGEAWLTELSTQELKELFALRREAVADV